MNAMERYFQYRQGLMAQYKKGDMDKGEYLDRNLDEVLGLREKPFKYIDTLEKCLFNYQYYNAMEKKKKMTSNIQINDKYRDRFAKEADYFYNKKDGATLKVLEILDYRDMEAYFIKTKSPYLKGKLFEILIEDYDTILHSTSDYILDKLRYEHVFIEETRVSKIDHYINAKY